MCSLVLTFRVLPNRHMLKIWVQYPWLSAISGRYASEDAARLASKQAAQGSVTACRCGGKMAVRRCLLWFEDLRSQISQHHRLSAWVLDGQLELALDLNPWQGCDITEYVLHSASEHPSFVFYCRVMTPFLTYVDYIITNVIIFLTNHDNESF